AYRHNGTLTDIRPFAVFSAPAATIEVPHVLSTVYFAGSATIMAYFALMLMLSKDRKRKEYYGKALRLAFGVCMVAVVFAIITGVLSIESLMTLQPEKYAAIEINVNTTANAPEIIGGTIVNGTVQGAWLIIPTLQSLLAGGTASAVVPGLSQFPRSTWPPLFIHTLFDLMVMFGFGIGGVLALLLVMHLLKVRVFDMKIVQIILVLIGCAAIFILEAGWIVDEVGRQPWIIYNVMAVSQAANQSQTSGLLAILIIIAYAVILPITYFVIRAVFSKRPLDKELRQ
ncbi:MAG: cytochrome ubiquinol oxidase subunit I, partial [Candidatus Micrarchaeota archaeon]|nr:cytochrome ubiquinol oxidase subunit I [Candidatus Micrarchaeota archaeon]